jgi:hypothetical protein
MNLRLLREMEIKAIHGGIESSMSFANLGRVTLYYNNSSKLNFYYGLSLGE